MSNYADALRGSEKSKDLAPSTTNPSRDDSRRGQTNQPPLTAQNRWQAPAGGSHPPWQRPKASRKVSETTQKQSAGGPVQKKSKKPKPSLQRMSLGDVMAPKILGQSKKRPSSPMKRPAPTSKPRADTTYNLNDFPALGSSSNAVKSTSTPNTITKFTPDKQTAASSGLSRATLAPRGGKLKHSVKKEEKELKGSATMTNPKSAKLLSKKPSNKIGGRSGDSGFRLPSHSLEVSVKQDTDSGAHDLIRLAQLGKITSQKGRQRVNPRMKKFTTLKKKVLQERLQRWRELHPEESNSKEAPSVAASEEGTAPQLRSCTVCIENFATPEEVEESDEYEEILANLEEMASKVGPVVDVLIPRDSVGPTGCPAFVMFSTAMQAAAAQSCWDGLVIGGQRLSVHSVVSELVNETSKVSPNESWRQSILAYSLQNGDISTSSTVDFPKLQLRNVLTSDDFEDEDCMSETIADMHALVAKFGTVTDIEAREGDQSLIVSFSEGSAVVRSAAETLDGANVAGVTIMARVLPLHETANETSEVSNVSGFTVVLKNALTDDDFEDTDNLEESLDDIRELAQCFGTVADVKAKREGGILVHITYSGTEHMARNAAKELDETVLGGQVITASVLEQVVDDSTPEAKSCVLIRNLLTEDDMEDSECLEETKRDVAELAEMHGSVIAIEVETQGSSNVMKVLFREGEEVAARAAKKFNCLTIGGQQISATVSTQIDGTNEVQNDRSVSSVANPTTLPHAAPKTVDPVNNQMFSGDKLIAERFAECKRVPKVPSADTAARNYGTKIDTDVAKQLLIEMLGELMRLQKRAIEDKNAKARRRIVMGLREVARGIRANKVKMVVMANNLDDYGAIDSKLQEILDLAKAQDIPVLFELNKRHLGKAVGKNIKIGVVGVQNADGAHQQFKKLAAMAPK